ncbi:T9SS type A sorting domain-containing protein [Fulvivirgaceae bacterium BMA12]|uniref:T9SS type A sorting domain-containing protein n=1 Tax=Agaribacillus aureus TaxID=3051825 RepID=A0ABT8LE68_9BACT|nr:T9SS type A sorting domain-containing protein [Fulvivirgaceae bacterium BMA12]
MKKPLIVYFLCFLLADSFFSIAQPTAARAWNEVLLEGIRNDFARPTVHARNLFHISAAMYDCWAVYDNTATPFFLGREIDGFKIDFEGIEMPSNVAEARNEALSYACYRLINHRFEFSPGADETLTLADNLMADLGYDTGNGSQSYSSGSPAALGNYLAAKIIDFGLQDGSNEVFGYRNLDYLPVNPPMIVARPGSQGIVDPNHWQPLAFDVFVDQAGNELPGNVPDFLSPEWGNTVPFALQKSDAKTLNRDDVDYTVYYDPGPPAYFDPSNASNSEDYRWGFSLVSIWSSHLDPADGVLWDISPGKIGNLQIGNFPTTIEQLQTFYDQIEGGDFSTGYTINPKTNQPYAQQLVPRGDYSRVLAEFWADGPDSETPPGHWFTILNYVNDHDQLVKKFKGTGDVIDDFEWDVKSYFLLGGAMHDAAICAWSIKGYYDYIRPISAIRYMADQGQSSDPGKLSYAETGIPLIDGFIELVTPGDPLAGDNDEHVGKIKLFAWKGPDFINDPEVDAAGVGWILAENWWPYQRPTFVTPPFAGYVSGHSTYSRAAAEVLSMLTGDEYFPGGMGEFIAPKNEFLVFEEGPSVDVTLQWAKYYDASDQCSLSRIWGGIHPPVDDVPGRLIGQKVGLDAFAYAENFFDGNIVVGIIDQEDNVDWYPNPVRNGFEINLKHTRASDIQKVQLMRIDGSVVDTFIPTKSGQSSNFTRIKLSNQPEGIYILRVQLDNQLISRKIVIADY